MTRILIFMGIIGICTAGAVLAAETDCADDSRYPEVSRKELATLVEKKKVFVIDVNSASSFKKAHVPGAIHYGSNRNELAAKLPKDKDALIVAYCGGPKCTAWQAAAEKACELGYTNVRHYKGGIQGWIEGS